MRSIRNLEGYLLIDHRNSPGVPADLLLRAGLPLEAGRGLYESACYTCSHCQRIVWLNPQRTREREYCRGCQKIICDPCAAERAITLECRTFQQKLDKALEAAERTPLVAAT